MAEDQIEKALTDAETALTTAWQNNRCVTCPLGELAALISAVKTFYVLNRGKNDPAKWVGLQGGKRDARK